MLKIISYKELHLFFLGKVSQKTLGMWPANASEMGKPNTKRFEAR